jgi:hypothetical protein
MLRSSTKGSASSTIHAISVTATGLAEGGVANWPPSGSLPAAIARQAHGVAARQVGVGAVAGERAALLDEDQHVTGLAA